MDNTAQLPIRVQLYWQGGEARSRDIPASLVADMYTSQTMAYTLVHGWIEATFITKGRLFDLPFMDIMKLGRANEQAMIDKTYSDETGTARVVLVRAVPHAQVRTPATMSEYGKNDMGYT